MSNNNKNEVENTNNGESILFANTPFYECGRCKLVPNDYKEYMIQNDMLNIVIKYIHLFET